jgi:uroporphyrinogen-III synthase
MKNKTILITRAAHQAQTLQQLIHDAGGKTLLFPTLSIAFTTAHGEFQRIISALTTDDIAIFTSANAVAATAPFWQSSAALSVMAIGPGTAKALAMHQIKCQPLPLHFSSEGLLALPDLQQIKHKKIVIFCGENPRPLLKQTLLQRGALVDEAICYRRSPPVITAAEVEWLTAQPIDYILSTSRNSLENLVALLAAAQAWLRQQTLIVINDDMLAQAYAFGFKHVIVASDASDQAVVQALMSQVQ